MTNGNQGLIGSVLGIPVRVILMWTLLAGDATGGDPGQRVDFDRDIRPLLSDSCYQCHGPDASSRQARLRLDRRDGLMKHVVEGQPGKSELFRRISSSDPDVRMPPSTVSRPLTPAQQDLLRRWIAQGGDWTRHWSLESIRRPPVPLSKSGHPVRNAIDHFIQARLSGHGLVPSPEADRERLLRRVTLDLTGLPPTPVDRDSAMADPSDGWYERVVDRLLASPRSGEHLARHWLDLARYADTDGYQDDEPRVMWRWRDWVIDAFNDGMPYDRFTIEQLAGDLLPNATPAQVLATGFNRNNRTNGEGGSIAEEFRVEYIIDRVDTVATTWLGLTLACARCHDHKYDPLSQRDFYRLFAFYNNTPEKGIYRRNAAPLLKIPTRQVAAELESLARDIASLPENGPRRALLEKQRQALLKSVPTTMVMKEGDKRVTRVLRRGQYDQPGDQVEAGVPDSLPPLDQDQPRNRLGLARWLMSDPHPLTARVVANRTWQLLMGHGLVATPEDFGSQGARPSHPLLLDWLASELKASGWQLRQLVREVVCSHTYRQSSRVRPVDRQRDPDNRWLARSSRLRLEAEIIRDQALAASGLLVEHLGGPSVRPYQPAGLWNEIAGGTSSAYTGGYKPDKGAGLYRRSLYTFWRRTIPPPVMATFDAPSREACTVRRGRTNTPLQALALMNDPVYVESARQLAVGVWHHRGTAEQVRMAFVRVLGREPLDNEQQVLVASTHRSRARFVKQPAAAKLVLSVGASPPATVDDPGRIPELAALVATCHVILNLDEAITRE
mgnify:CR=1 FL=1